LMGLVSVVFIFGMPYIMDNSTFAAITDVCVDIGLMLTSCSGPRDEGRNGGDAEEGSVVRVKWRCFADSEFRHGGLVGWEGVWGGEWWYGQEAVGRRNYDCSSKTLMRTIYADHKPVDIACAIIRPSTIDLREAPRGGPEENTAFQMKGKADIFVYADTES